MGTTAKRSASDLVNLTDLRGITRRSDRCSTVITIQLDWDTRVRWLVLGETQIRRQSESRLDGRWRLQAYLKDGATDFEHDSAYALWLPLIGLQLGELAVHYHATSLVAWVDPNAQDDFRVPRPGYNPLTHPKALICKDKRCEKKHVIVPEGLYAGPPSDPDLFRAVAGKQLEISIGPVSEG